MEEENIHDFCKNKEIFKTDKAQNEAHRDICYKLIDDSSAELEQEYKKSVLRLYQIQ